MRRCVTWLIVAAFWSKAIALAQLQLLPNAEPQAVFAGTNRSISLCWHNAGETVNETQIQSRMMQLTSATAVCVGGAPWKKLQVLPGQTVLESAALDFPPVRAKTRFLVLWVDGASNVLGSTEVFVYPTNLLAELGILMNHDENALGVDDPQNQLKPLLKNEGVQFVDLANSELKNFRGKLAIIGPFASKAATRDGLANDIKTMAKNGAAVVWLQPPREHSAAHWDSEKLQPSFCSVLENNTAVVIVQADLVADLAANPRAQLNLIHLCKLALRPEAPHLPNLSIQP